MEEMVAIANQVGTLTTEGEGRLARAMATIGPMPDIAEMPALLAKRDALLQLAA